MKFSYSRFDLPHDPSRYLHTVSSGNRHGPTLLCLHGATGNWSNYRPLFSYFANHYRIETMDMRGHGRSPWRPGGLDDFYQDLESYAATLPKPMLVLAHSFGGYFGVRLAAHHSDWLTHLVLFNTARCLPPTLSLQILRHFSPWADLMVQPEGIIASNTTVTRYLVNHVLNSWDCTPYYKLVRCPVLGIAGKLDPLIPHHLARSSLNSLSNHQFRSLPWGMHVAMWECPSLLHRWICHFVEET